MSSSKADDSDGGPPSKIRKILSSVLLTETNISPDSSDTGDQIQSNQGQNLNLNKPKVETESAPGGKISNIKQSSSESQSNPVQETVSRPVPRKLCSLGTGEIVHILALRAKEPSLDSEDSQRVQMIDDFEFAIQTLSRDLYKMEAGITDVRVCHPMCGRVCFVLTFTDKRELQNFRNGPERALREAVRGLCSGIDPTEYHQQQEVQNHDNQNQNQLQTLVSQSSALSGTASNASTTATVQQRLSNKSNQTNLSEAESRNTVQSNTNQMSLSSPNSSFNTKAQLLSKNSLTSIFGRLHRGGFLDQAIKEKQKLKNRKEQERLKEQTLEEGCQPVGTVTVGQTQQGINSIQLINNYSSMIIPQKYQQSMTSLQYEPNFPEFECTGCLMPMVHDLQSLLSFLKSNIKGTSHTDHNVKRIAEECAKWFPRYEEYKAYIHWDKENPTKYTRNLVFRNEFFEALLMCWPPGCQSAIHCHDKSSCWVVLVDGEVYEVQYSMPKLDKRFLESEMKDPSGAVGRCGGLRFLKETKMSFNNSQQSSTVNSTNINNQSKSNGLKRNSVSNRAVQVKTENSISPRSQKYSPRNRNNALIESQTHVNSKGSLNSEEYSQEEVSNFNGTINSNRNQQLQFDNINDNDNSNSDNDDIEIRDSINYQATGSSVAYANNDIGVHRIENRDPINPAYTLHIYAPGLRKIKIFKESGGVWIHTVGSQAVNMSENGSKTGLWNSKTNPDGILDVEKWNNVEQE